MHKKDKLTITQINRLKRALNRASKRNQFPLNGVEKNITCTTGH